jgi:hypothetical protein
MPEQSTKMTNAANNTPATEPNHGGGLFAALRRQKGLIDANDGELNVIVSSGEMLAGFWCLPIVAALAAEAVFAAFPLPSPLDRVAGFAVNALIAVSVFGELFFHRRSADVQDEKLRRSNERLAKVALENGILEERATEARERAAVSERKAQEIALKAAEAQIILQRLSSPRVPDGEMFLGALQEQPKPAKIDVLYSMDGADCASLAAWIAKYLRDAGWPVDPEYPLVIPRSAVPNITSAQLEGAQPWGITILVPGGKGSGGPANALVNALFESLGSPLIAAVRTEKIPHGNLRVVVAPRP